MINKLVRKILLFLYDKKIKKLDTLKNKIEYLQLINIDFNKREYGYINVKSRFSSLYKYISFLEDILKLDIVNNKIPDKLLNNKQSSFSVREWLIGYNDLRHIENNNFEYFLELVNKLLYELEHDKDDMKLRYYSSNYRKLFFYIIDIENIMNVILNEELEDELISNSNT